MTFSSNIQRMCTGEPEFVVGEVYGLRQWVVSPAGKLFGHHSHAWDGKVQEATCKKKTYNVTFDVPIWRLPEESTPDDLAAVVEEGILAAMKEFPDLIRIAPYPTGVRTWQRGSADTLSISDWALDIAEDLWEGGDKRLELWITLPTEKHEVTYPGCVCGFYAYTDMDSLRNNSQITLADSVFGIVRSWGAVTQGTKGFRAQYAEIVGLTGRMQGERDFGLIAWDDTSRSLKRHGGVTRWWNVPRTEPLPLADISRYNDLDDLWKKYKELTRQ